MTAGQSIPQIFQKKIAEFQDVAVTETRQLQQMLIPTDNAGCLTRNGAFQKLVVRWVVWNDQGQSRCQNHLRFHCEKLPKGIEIDRWKLSGQLQAHSSVFVQNGRRSQQSDRAMSPSFENLVGVPLKKIPETRTLVSRTVLTCDSALEREPSLHPPSSVWRYELVCGLSR